MRVAVCRRFLSLSDCGSYWGQIQFYSWVKARVHPEWVASSLQDPYWWQWLPHKVPSAHQEQFGGSVSYSRLLRHVAQSHPRGARDSNKWPSDHWSTSSIHWVLCINDIWRHQEFHRVCRYGLETEGKSNQNAKNISENMNRKYNLDCFRTCICCSLTVFDWHDVADNEFLFHRVKIKYNAKDSWNMTTNTCHLSVVEEEKASFLVYPLSLLSSPPWRNQLSARAWLSCWLIYNKQRHIDCTIILHHWSQGSTEV